jgi:hypothetical protein
MLTGINGVDSKPVVKHLLPRKINLRRCANAGSDLSLAKTMHSDLEDRGIITTLQTCWLCSIGWPPAPGTSVRLSDRCVRP